MKLAVGGAFPYPAARQAGVAVGLGTDGPGSNDSLDPLADLKVFALAQRQAARDPTILPAEEAWRVATGACAPLLTTLNHELHQFLGPAGGEVDAARRGGGALRTGGPADFLLLRGNSPELGLGDLHSDLVYAASGSIVDTTVVAGRVLMRGGAVPGTDEVVARAEERAKRLGIG
jgi:5-methylthioadenosine/S-adenosylhomocysteine deaminase